MINERSMQKCTDFMFFFLEIRHWYYLTEHAYRRLSIWSLRIFNEWNKWEGKILHIPIQIIMYFTYFQQGEYMTIHITPENQFSYVSFETNVALSNYRKLINQVINTFKPGKFIVTIFANKVSFYIFIFWFLFTNIFYLNSALWRMKPWRSWKWNIPRDRNGREPICNAAIFHHTTYSLHNIRIIIKIVIIYEIPIVNECWMYVS